MDKTDLVFDLIKTNTTQLRNLKGSIIDPK